MNFVKSKDSEGKVDWLLRLTSLRPRVSCAVGGMEFEGDGDLSKGYLSRILTSAILTRSQPQVWLYVSVDVYELT